MKMYLNPIVCFSYSVAKGYPLAHHGAYSAGYAPGGVMGYPGVL
jgi:hypothetical protein